VLVTQSTSIETRFPKANVVQLSDLNGVGELNTLYASVIFVVKAVVQATLQSNVVVPLVLATVHTQTSAQINLAGSKAILLFITSFHTTPTVHA